VAGGHRRGGGRVAVCDRMYRAWVLRAVIAPSWEYSGGDLGHAAEMSCRDGLTTTVGRTAGDDTCT